MRISKGTALAAMVALSVATTATAADRASTQPVAAVGISKVQRIGAPIGRSNKEMDSTTTVVVSLLAVAAVGGGVAAALSNNNDKPKSP